MPVLNYLIVTMVHTYKKNKKSYLAAVELRLQVNSMLQVEILLLTPLSFLSHLLYQKTDWSYFYLHLEIHKTCPHAHGFNCVMDKVDAFNSVEPDC